MDEKKAVRERRSVSNIERREAFENTTKSALAAMEEERRKRIEKTDRLKKARLSQAPKDREK